MKRTILLVYPEIPTTYWSLKGALEFVGNESLMPPLGLITIAAMLPDHYEVKLVDMNVDELHGDDIAWADIVFISAMIVQKESFFQVVSICNSLGVPVAAGGPYPTTSCEMIDGVDYFILNEGEVTLPRFIEDYERGEPQEVYLDETKPDITKTPAPRFDLLNIDVYATMAIQSSRGCPFNCEFCDIIEMFGRNPRYKTPEQIQSEMAGVYNTGYRGPLFIVDDNFIGNIKRVKELLRGIIDWQKSHDYPFSLFTEASINLAGDENLLDLMVEAGFDMVFIGLETPDDEALKMTKKQQNVKADLLTSVKTIQERGIEVLAGFILGFDNEPEDIFDRQIQFIQKAGIPMAMIGLMMALPKTQLYRRLKNEDRLLCDSDGNNTHSLEMNFIPTMDKETLVAGYKRVLSEIYSPKKYFNRCLTMLKRFPKKRFYNHGDITFRDIKALLKSLIKQTFTGYGLHYLWYLVRSLFINIREFPLAVTLAIKGYHFFSITEDILLAGDYADELSHSLRELDEDLKELTSEYQKKYSIAIEKHGNRVKSHMNRKFKNLNGNVKATISGELNSYSKRSDEMIEYYKNELTSQKGVSSYNKIQSSL